MRQCDDFDSRERVNGKRENGERVNGKRENGERESGKKENGEREGAESGNDESGRIHSIETFGTVDGPGVRFVVFFQGCPLRCLYCHNPDTWKTQGGRRMKVEEILAAFEKNRQFYRRGGLTATGGEPLMQLSFLTALFTAAKARNIHTCLDTSGILFRDENRLPFERLAQVTDLVLLDIKHVEEAVHKKLTSHSGAPAWAFLRFLEEQKVPVWIRHVMVPGYTDSRGELEALGRALAPFSNIQALELLPYHSMGEKKYQALNMEYPLAGVKEPSQDQAAEARQWLLKAFQEGRKK